ncbi:MAG: hypothetical protein FJW23_11735 [Acidimicrobiia bacterium]|nr:hypothetical protein [Acidimicrobiia bacterium]
MSNKTPIALALIVAVAAAGCGDSEDPVYADTHPLSVPLIVTPSVQVGNGEAILYKVSNVSTGSASFRMMFYTDDDHIPAFHRDYERVRGGHTVTFVYEPPMAPIEIGGTTVEVPQAIRATVAPIPLVDHNVGRKVVANVQIVRVHQGADGAPPTLETREIVPLSHCNYEPRTPVPTGLWYWNCAPGIYPLKPLPPS